MLGLISLTFKALVKHLTVKLSFSTFSITPTSSIELELTASHLYILYINKNSVKQKLLDFDIFLQKQK